MGLRGESSHPPFIAIAIDLALWRWVCNLCLSDFLSVRYCFDVSLRFVGFDLAVRHPVLPAIDTEPACYRHGLGIDTNSLWGKLIRLCRSEYPTRLKRARLLRALTGLNRTAFE